jgi:uncharacterized SAM-binding protein YcdF (DUF218 family)
MAMLREDLFQAFLIAARSANLAVLSGMCQLALSLYVYLGRHLLLQLEVFITSVLLRLAEGKGATKIEQQEAALEVLGAWGPTAETNRMLSILFGTQIRASGQMGLTSS